MCDFFSTISGDECDFGCKCFEKVLDCTEMGFSTIPNFKKTIKLSTESLLLRKMPTLDLTNFILDEWMNLKEIDLTGIYKFRYLKKILKLQKNAYGAYISATVLVGRNA